MLRTAELDPPNDSLPLIFLDLIDWDEPKNHDMAIFPNDDSIIRYLCTINPEIDSTSEQSNTICNQGSAKSLSHINEQNQGYIAKNQSMVALDHKKVKLKDASTRENLFKAPKDGRLDTLLGHYQERSPILIEPTQSINIGTTEIAKNIHLTESLTEEETSEFIQFFKAKQINFAWSYADMPRIDTQLIMHYLSITPGAKPIKQKLRKMNRHVALMVKVELKKLLDVGFI
ncbi:hypothetical protein SUGI_0376620 [Cryptomeria japonica]|nr:hypothetical protein SUGI_0376620 [Cryptomeria japonica]